MSTKLCWLTLICLVLSGLLHGAAEAGVTGANVDESAVAVTLYVSQQHPAATDKDNTGESADHPLASFAAGFKIAASHLRENRGVKLVIGPGTYREGGQDLVLNCRDWPQENRSATLIIEGTERGKVILSGSDDWSGGWLPVEGHPGLYSKPWKFNWGLGTNPWYERFGVIVEALGNRREVVWIDGNRLTQVLLEKYVWFDPEKDTRQRDPDGRARNLQGEWKYEGFAGLDALAPGTYGVTEMPEHGQRIYVRPTEGVDLNAARVEVAIRETLLRIVERENVVLRNLTFTHSNSAVGGGTLPILLQVNNLLVDSCDVVENNSRGMSFGKHTRDITVRNSRFNHNGWSGAGGSSPDNLLLVDNESNYNNWRGHLGDQHGCDAAGIKFVGPRGPKGAHIIRHKSLGNLAHGLWFDHVESETAPITIEDSLFVANQYGDQLYIEKQAGPLRITRSVLWNVGGGHAIKMVGRDITIDRSVLYAAPGATSVFHLGARNNSPYRFVENWTLTDNLIAVDGKTWFYHSFQSLRAQEHDAHTLKTLTASGNLYASPSGPDARLFVGEGKKMCSFADWLRLTGAETTSRFATDLPFVEAARFDWRLKPGTDHALADVELPRLGEEEVRALTEIVRRRAAERAK